MNKLTIICSIDGWKTTENINMVQTKGKGYKIYDGNTVEFDEPPYQLDCFYVTVNATNLGEAADLVNKKLIELNKELFNKYDGYAIYGLTSYPVACPENIEESIDIQNLSLVTIVKSSRLLQQLNRTEYELANKTSEKSIITLEKLEKMIEVSLLKEAIESQVNDIKSQLKGDLKPYINKYDALHQLEAISSVVFQLHQLIKDESLKEEVWQLKYTAEDLYLQLMGFGEKGNLQ